MRPFRQVNVFSSEPLLGNPVAVVEDAEGLSDADMADLARWTNLSETTFLLPPTDERADYRLRIWTPGGELPFAGHPTLGSAHAWLEAGGVPRAAGEVVQECGAGLVRVRVGLHLSFAAPPLVRSGPVSATDLSRVAAALAVDEREIVDAAWIDNGPGWVGVLLRDAAAVLACTPDPTKLDGLDIGIVGLYPPGSPEAVEVRAFAPGAGVVEDPVTGSLNAGIAQWLVGSRLNPSYVASQGTVLGRRGRIHVTVEGGSGDLDESGGVVWVGGDTRTVITGTVAL